MGAEALSGSQRQGPYGGWGRHGPGERRVMNQAASTVSSRLGVLIGARPC